ncbi:VOC family protein [Henriciella litoralis]|uniref:VOC family protein n=1 Tax=Henriciella litoralis TaxID=568102 RepID=UPI000A00A547|nr:VOC family protein [Henriciella litoralis]
MLAYVTLGSNDTEKALAFYDALMPEMGAKRFFDNERLYFYGTAPGQPMLAIGGTYDGEPATCGNGVMPALACDSNETVDRVYKKAIELGAKDEGAPGNRMPTFYGAYFRDPDGHKICVCKLG